MDGARNGEDLVQQQDLQHRRNPAVAHDRHQQQRPPPLRCPRCDSSNTKFCYYNNYSLSQPRYFCKACRRYWTQGGTLRTVPIGGGCRKAKRLKIPAPSSPSLSPSTQGLSTAAAWSQNLCPSQPPPLGGSFFAGGSSLSAVAAMQSLPVGGISQGAATMGVGGGRFGSNMTLLQGMTFPPQQSLIPPGRFSSWPQSVINGSASSSSAGATSALWSSSGADGSDQAGPSFTPNQRSESDCDVGFNPSH